MESQIIQLQFSFGEKPFDQTETFNKQETVTTVSTGTEKNNNDELLDLVISDFAKGDNHSLYLLNSEQIRNIIA